MKRVAVIGAGIGGLSAALESVALGHHVEIFERASSVGGKAQVVKANGCTLDTGPTLLTMPHTVRQTFERLAATDLLPPLHRLSLHTRYSWADGARFDCFEDVAQTQASVGPIDAEDAAALPAFYGDAERIFAAAGEPYLEAPYEHFSSFMLRVLKRGPAAMLKGLSMSTLDALARRHFRSRHLREFVGRFATYTGASPYSASAAFAMIPHIERAFGVHHVEGGMGALVRALEAAVRRAGVRIHTNASAYWHARGAGFIAGPLGGEAEFDTIIVNADPLAQLGRTSEPLALSGYVFLLTADRRLELPHHSVVFSSDYAREFEQLFRGELPDDPTIYVCHPAATDSTMAPDGMSGLFVMVNAPAFTDAASAQALWSEAAPRVRAQCLARLKPLLGGATVTLVGERTPLDVSRTGAPGGSIYGFLPHGRFGPFRRPALASVVPGVFYAGGGTHPGGGVPLVMLSGRFAATLANRHVRGAS